MPRYGNDPGLELDQRASVPSKGPEAEKPSWLENLAADFRIQADEEDIVQGKRLFEAYQPYVRAVAAQRGVSPFRYMNDRKFLFGSEEIYNLDQLWSDVADERLRNTKAFPDLPATREEFERQVLTRHGGRNRDMQVSQRGGSWTSALVGGIGAAALDPVNVYSLGLGGSGSLARVMLTEGALNGGIELAETPMRIENRARMGEQTSTADVARDVGAATAFGALLPAVPRAAGATVDAGIVGLDKVSVKAGKAIDALRPYIPERWRSIGTLDELPDEALVETVEDLVPEDLRVGEIGAALHVAETEGYVRATNPWKPDGAGVAAHEQTMAQVMQSIIDGPLGPPRNGANVTIGASSGRGGANLSIPGAGVAGDAGMARNVFKSKVRAKESSGNDQARPRDPKTGKLLSSAYGRYQFIESTWLSLYKKRYGRGGLTDDQILAKRSNGDIQEVLMDDLIAENERALRGAGITLSPGNLYLAHFSGYDKAIALHRAAPNATALSVLGRDAINSNPFLRNMSAADVIAWAERKMTGGQVRSGGGSAAPTDDMGEALRFWNEQAAEQDAALAGARDGEIVPEPKSAEVEISAPADIPVRDGGLSAEQSAFLPALREDIASESKPSLQPVALASRHGISEADAAAALDYLAARRQGVFQTAGRNAPAQIRRLPSQGPEDVLTFVARRGGLRDDEGDRLGIKGLSAAEEKSLTGSQKRDAKRRRQGGGRDLQTFVPGAGPLLRQKGRSLDELGELLHEAGYTVERPTTDEVLSMIERAAGGEKIYALGDDMDAAGRFAREYDPDVEAFVSSFEREYGIELTDEEIGDLMRVASYDADLDAAYTDFVNARADSVIMDAYFEEVPEAARYYEDLADDGFATENRPFAPDSAEPAGVLADQIESVARIEAGGSWTRQDAIAQERGTGAPLDRDALSEFDDPLHGTGPKAEADSLMHDAEDMFGGPTREERRAALERQGNELLRGEGEQRPAGSDGGLFDNEAAQMDIADYGVRLDAEGDVVNPADLLAEIEADEAMLKNVRDCL